MSEWNKLSMRDRASYIRNAVARGIYDVDNIRQDYHQYATDGNLYYRGGWFSQHKNRWNNFLIGQGLSNEDADRLSGFFAAQDGLESAGGTSNAAIKHNNYGGMQKNGRNIHYDSVSDYMADKWSMMNRRFASALQANTLEEYGTILGDPANAGKGYLYYVADGYNSRDPQNAAWVARQNAHMNNYIAGMQRYYGSPSQRSVVQLSPIHTEQPDTLRVVNPYDIERPVILNTGIEDIINDATNEVFNNRPIQNSYTEPVISTPISAPSQEVPKLLFQTDNQDNIFSKKDRLRKALKKGLEEPLQDLSFSSRYSNPYSTTNTQQNIAPALKISNNPADYYENLYDRYYKFENGGNLNGWKTLLQKAKKFLSREQTEEQQQDKKTVYRNQEGVEINTAKGKRILPKRLRENNSPTKEASTKTENDMARHFAIGADIEPVSNPNYDIPFIEDKKFIINNATTSTNVLDTLAKYTALHNANVQKAKDASSKAKPRKLDFGEAIGLMHESVWGAQPYYNTSQQQTKEDERALANSNYFTAFGALPAEYFVRDWHYKNSKVDTTIPPMLDALRYYAQGDYNRGDSNHTYNTQKKGKEYMENTTVKQWVKENRNKPEYRKAFLRADGGPIVNMFQYGGDILSELNWPALGSIQFNTYPDSTFVEDLINNRGYISTITPNQVTALWGGNSNDYEPNRNVYNDAQGKYVKYVGNERHLVNPTFGENAIIYNPKYTNRDAISLDALHIMHDNPMYQDLYNDYVKSANGNVAIYDTARDEFGDKGIEILDKYYTGQKLSNKEQEIINPIFDAFLRRQLSPSYMWNIKGGYETPVDLNNTVLGDKINNIKDYLESYQLPEVAVTPNSHSLGGPIVEAANRFDDGGYTYIGSQLPEITVTAPRKYFSHYDNNGNPVYTKDYYQSQDYLNTQLPISETEAKRKQWYRDNTNIDGTPKAGLRDYAKDIANVVELGIGLPLAPIAAAPVAEGLAPIMEAAGRPLTTLTKGVSKVLPNASKALPYTEWVDRGIMGTAGITGMYNTGKDWYQGNIPWYQAIPELGLEGLMAYDAAPLVSKGLNKAKLAFPQTASTITNAVPRITSENAALTSAAQWDAAYNNAINAGDMAEVQRLRDLHFMNNTPNNVVTTNWRPYSEERGLPQKLYHGTYEDWNIYDPERFGETDLGFFGKGIYTTRRKQYAETFGDKVKELYGYSKKPLDNLRGSKTREAIPHFGRNLDMTNATPEIKDLLLDADGVNIYRRASFSSPEYPFDEMVFPLHGKNIKLADAITYDDVGNIIPLSQRDNFSVNDIRYSLGNMSTEELENSLLTGYPIERKALEDYLGVDDAIRYANSKERMKLFNDFIDEGRRNGFFGEDFNPSMDMPKPTPIVEHASLPEGVKGEYDYPENKITLGKEATENTPFHEALHWQRVGNYQRMEKDEDVIGITRAIRRLDSEIQKAKSSGNVERAKSLTQEKNALNQSLGRIRLNNEYLQDLYYQKAQIALTEEAGEYLRAPSELAVNGLTTGRALGLKPFSKYPGDDKIDNIIKQAIKHNEHLEDVKHTTPYQKQTFWKILTGNYIPVSAGVLFGTTTMAKDK